MRAVIAILLSIIICLGTSCQKEFSIDDNSGQVTPPVTPPPAVSGNFTAKIDGSQFVANKVATASRALNVIAITGQSNDGGLIVIRVADSGVHVYSLDINSLTNAGAYTKDNGIAFTTNGGTPAQSGGTLSITSIDVVNKKMSGTFSVKVFRPIDGQEKNITEGVFTNISYETTPLPPASVSDTFRVKTDGTQFPVSSIMAVSAFGMISVSASDQAVSKTVGLSFKSTITPGSYNFSLFGLDYIAQYNIGTSYLVGSSGTLTILEHNTTTKKIRGNFNFKAAEIVGSKTADLTEGYFSVSYK